MNKNLISILTTTSFLLLNACAKKEDPNVWIEGRWVFTGAAALEFSAGAGFDFRPNGELHAFVPNPKNPDVEVVMNGGTWSLEGENLVIRPNNEPERRSRVIKTEGGFLMQPSGAEQYLEYVRP